MSDYMAQKADEQIEAGLSEWEKMCAQIDELKKDKARLEWLIENNYHITEGISSYWLSESDSSYRCGGKYETPREAIDAAMEETK